MFANNSSYAEGFVKYWTGAFSNTESVALLALGVGLFCVLVIVFTGRWKR